MHRALLALSAALRLAAQDFTVSPTGDDTSTGSAQAPLRTIQRAVDLAQPGDVVTVGAGVYRETVRPPRSGTAGNPIVIRAAAGGQAIVSGTRDLGGWQAVGGDVWEAPMPAGFFASTMNQADQLFLDGTMIAEGRWPDAGADFSHPVVATLDRFVSKSRSGNVTTVQFEDDAVPDGVVGAAITIQPNAEGWGWILSGRVTAQAGKRLTIQSFNDNGVDGDPARYAVGARYHLSGLRSFADAAWEWYHDSARGVVVLRVPSGVDPNTRHLEAKARDLGIDLTDRSWIAVSGLSLLACTLTSDRDAGGDSVGYATDGSPRYPYAAAGRVAAAANLVVDRLTVDYPNHFTDVSGHFYLQWTHNTGLVIAGSDLLVSRCVVRKSAGNGISLQGRRVRCIGNTVEDADASATDCAGISTGVQSLADDIEIGWNRIVRTARSGMTLRGLRNSAGTHQVTRVHHNEVTEWGCRDWDVGAFYTAGQDGRFVRIDHNRFWCTEPREGMVFGMYWDFSKNYLADHNLIWGVPTPVQVTRAFGDTNDGDSNLVIHRNTAVPNDAPWGRPFAAARGIGSVVVDNLFKVADFRKPDGNWENQWPAYGNDGVTGSNLLYGDRAGVYWTMERELRAGDLHSTTLAFPDPANGDFRPQAGSPAIGAALAVGAITRDGIAVAIADEGPDIGALAAGEPVFTTGPAHVPSDAGLPADAPSDGGGSGSGSGGGNGNDSGNGGGAAGSGAAAASGGDGGGGGCGLGSSVAVLCGLALSLRGLVRSLR